MGKEVYEKLRISSWNVGTIIGRKSELADILKRSRVNIACAQETKWKRGHGKRDREWI